MPLRSDMKDLMEMIVHTADENAKEARLARLIRRHGHGRSEEEFISVASLENAEWLAFKAKLQRRSLLIAGKGASVDGAATLATGPNEDVEEDDVDMLLAVVSALEQKHPHPLTLTEITRELQRDKVLSREFVAVARQQTQRLLTKLRTLNRAWEDSQGRWSLQ